MNTEKKITIIILLIVIAGFTSELITQFDFLSIEKLFNIRGYLGATNLDFFRRDLFDFQLFERKQSINLANITFYFTLLIGVVLYAFSNGKESRILRFSMSIILLYNAFLILWMVTSRPIVLHLDQNQFREPSWTSLISALIRDIIWIMLSYWIVKSVNIKRQLDTITEELENGTNIKILISATKNQRFFHLIVDLIIVILLFSNFINFILEILPHTLNQRLMIWILSIIFRSIYYLFCEFTLGATPAKFLSETRVVDEDGEKLNFTTVFSRTVTRFIPFEPFSFLSNGWHDNWTGTLVVKEKSLGVGSSRYTYSFFITVILIGGIYWGNKVYQSAQNDKKEYLFRKKEHEVKTTKIEYDLAHLTTDNIIAFNNINNTSEEVYLKIEEIKKSSLLCSIIKFDYGTAIKVEEEYSLQKSNLVKAEIPKNQIMKAFTKDYETEISPNKNKIELLGNGIFYELKNIFRFYSPILKSDGGGSYDSQTIGIGMTNKGWNAKIIEIKNLIGTVKWQNELPINIENASKRYNSNFAFSGANFKTDEFYKFQFVTKDSLNRIETYTLEGVNLQSVLKKIR